jgi:hypothetical protein
MLNKSTVKDDWHFANYYSNGTLFSTNQGGGNTIFDSSMISKAGPVVGYRSKIKAGQQAGSNLSGFTRTVTPFSSRVELQRHVDLGNGDFRRQFRITSYPLAFMLVDSFLFPNDLGNLSEANANAEALTHLVKSIRGKQTAFQGGVALGELGQTLRMLRNPAIALRQGLDGYFNSLMKVRRIPSRQARRRALSETWLEYSFGWVPLINDIQDAKRLIQEKADTDARSRVYGEGQTSSATSGVISTVSVPPFSWTLSGETIQRVSVKYYGTCVAWRANKYSARSLGLDLTNFLPTAWELVPWSFLVDYFTNIGEIISAASLSTSGVRWIMQGVEKVVERRCSSASYNYPSPTVWKVNYDITTQHPTGTLRYVSRAPYTGSLVPNIRFEIPGMGLKWLNLAALARTHRSLCPFY